MSAKQGHDTLNTKGERGEKSCLVTTDTGESVMTARPDITKGLPKRDLTTMYILLMVSRETLPILNKKLVQLDTWVVPTYGLGINRPYD